MSGLYFYTKVLPGGKIRITREEMNEVVVDSLEALGEWLSVFSDQYQLIWGAGFCAREDDELPVRVPLVSVDCSTSTLQNAVKLWEMMANHPTTSETCTETYVTLATELANRKAS